MSFNPLASVRRVFAEIQEELRVRRAYKERKQRFNQALEADDDAETIAAYEDLAFSPGITLGEKENDLPLRALEKDNLALLQAMRPRVNQMIFEENDTGPGGPCTCRTRHILAAALELKAEKTAGWLLSRPGVSLDVTGRSVSYFDGRKKEESLPDMATLAERAGFKDLQARILEMQAQALLTKAASVRDGLRNGG